MKQQLFALVCVALISQSSADRALSLVREGEAHLAKGDLSSALKNAMDAVKLAPEDPRVAAFGAHALLDGSTFAKPASRAEWREKSRSLAGKALIKDPTNHEALEVLRQLDRRPFGFSDVLKARDLVALDEAESLYRKGDALVSAERFVLLAKRYPSIQGLWCFVGDAYLKSGEAERALDAYRQAVTPGGYWSAPDRGIGKCLELLGRKQEASLAYIQAVSSDPTDPLSWDGYERTQSWHPGGLVRLAVPSWSVPTWGSRGECRILQDIPAGVPTAKIWESFQIGAEVALGFQKSGSSTIRGHVSSESSAFLNAWMDLLGNLPAKFPESVEGQSDPLLCWLLRFYQQDHLEVAVRLLWHSQRWNKELSGWLRNHPDEVQSFLRKYPVRLEGRI
ncbi:MAG TPA: tetratricopeptide repeat protein [Holophagaceae bacterium]|nr:tetratricopeptide repeat protein [Holophagaceae bacterium]